MLWALFVALVLGLRKPDFPGNLAGQRTVSAITVVLVLAAMSTAVLTAGTPAGSGKAYAATSSTSTESAPAPSAAAPSATAHALNADHGGHHCAVIEHARRPFRSGR